VKRVAASLVAALLMIGPAAPLRAQDDGFSIDIVEEGVTDTDDARMEDAKDLAAQERFGEALGAFDAIMADAKLKKFHEEADYELAKTLYKMGAYHAALSRFERILGFGPKHPHFAQSREWVFFTARKVKDQLAALSVVARYAKLQDIPAEYQSELGYALGRYYFLLALELGAKGVEVEAQPEQAPDAPEGATPEDKPAEDKPAEDKPAEDDGGFNFSDESLGGGDIDGRLPAIARPGTRIAQDFELDLGEATDKKDPKKKKKRKAPPKEDKPAEAKAEEPKAPPPPAKQKHAFDGPKKAEDALKLSLENLARVKNDFTFYGQATYLKGLAHFARGEFDPAVAAFREVVRMTNPRGGEVENFRLREMAFFSLARIHYQFEQFRYAIFYYDRIDRDSEQWLESLFESSWAHFRLGEYEKALGNLVTLQSPFFQDEYYPESSILKAITYYENCRYDEAKAFLGEFKQSYGGVLAELDGLVGTQKDAKGPVTPKNAEQLFNDLTELEKKVDEGKDDQNRSFAITARLLRLALSDKRVKGYREAIAEVDEEKTRLQALSAPFAGSQTQNDLIAAVDQRRQDLVNLTGTLLKDKLEAERGFLTDLTSKLIRIQFEITKGEKETFEASMAGQGQQTTTLPYDFTTATDDERLYWPFEGEYWRDELGTYQYTLTRGCRPPEETTISGN
jgi:outer membrane protein assembly factor BamD (BamD/ComL family)